MTMGRDMTVHVVGAGLAGSECAWQLAEMGFKVHLYEMRGRQLTPAHRTPHFAELVCSNSFGNLGEMTAPGQLKWEAELLGSFILRTAKKHCVPAGMALGVDRLLFSQSITEQLKAHPNISCTQQCVQKITDLPRPLVLATGPLTNDALAKDLMDHLGENYLYFFDAIAPIIDADTIDSEIVWRQDRWGKGVGPDVLSDASPGNRLGDYLNCPLNRDQYYDFVENIKSARKIEPKEFEKTGYFEGCMPIEAIVERGVDTLRFGPMKPKGLINPRTGKMPFAVVQLRQENRAATSYNMVGFQTKMAYADQKEVFRKIPGLEQADFLKLGSIHRNLFVHTPRCLNTDLSTHKDPLVFLAGQIIGVEGYFESAVIGLLVSHMVAARVQEKTWTSPPPDTAMGALLAAVTNDERPRFQPTNINFGLFPPVYTDPEHVPPQRSDKKGLMIQRARTSFEFWKRGLSF